MDFHINFEFWIFGIDININFTIPTLILIGVVIVGTLIYLGG
jgi:hypothetical protein